METALIPYSAAPIPPHRVVLVLAPHPDDEVFGCGGAIALHAAAGARVHVVLITAGDAAGNGIERLSESACAARELGVAAPACWHIPDRHVRGDRELSSRITASIAETGATLIYAPSLWENHPDHRGLAEAVLDVVRRNDSISWMAYEISAPLRPNLLLDITPVLGRKRAAIACFPSQLALQRYDRHLDALNVYRTYTLPPTVEAAEAYEYYPAPALAAGGLTLIEHEHRRLLALAGGANPPDNASAAPTPPLQTEPSHLADPHQRLRELTTGRDAIRHSHSWRITRPLRALQRLLGRRSGSS